MIDQDRWNRYRQLGLHTDARIGWTLELSAQRWPNRESIVFDGTRVTFSQLRRWSTAVAQDLVAAGVQPGDRVLWQLPNSLEAIALHFAAWRIGAVSVPVVALYREHEMGQILEQIQPTVVAFASRQGQRRPASEMDELMAGLTTQPSVRLAIGEEVSGWAGVRPLPADDEQVDDTGPPGPPPPPTSAV